MTMIIRKTQMEQFSRNAKKTCSRKIYVKNERGQPIQGRAVKLASRQDSRQSRTDNDGLLVEVEPSHLGGVEMTITLDMSSQWPRDKRWPLQTLTHYGADSPSLNEDLEIVLNSEYRFVSSYGKSA